MNPEDNKIIEILENTAQGIKPNIVFEHELERRLTAAHKPKRNLFASLRQNIFPTLGWAVALVVLAFALNWATRSLLSGTPAAGDGFICPVTQPNGSLPPGETVESPEYLGNGELWTVLWPDGKVMMEQHNLESDGSLSMKWGWVRAVTGPLTIEGHRLDAEAEPLRADIPDGYGDTGFQVSALIFPTTGCWEVTGRVGDASLTFVTEVLFNGATPTPVAIQENSTPAPSTLVPTDGSYDWRGTTLTLAGSLPKSPAEANVYSLKLSQPATMDEARALAQQFGMNGEVTETPGEIPGNFDYLIMDGKQKLTVRSDHYFTYYSNTENFTLTKPPEEQAQIIIDTFLKQHGFDFEYRLETAPEMAGQHYYILPLTPDGFEMTFDFLMPLRFEITVEDIKNIIFSGYPVTFEEIGAPAQYGIISAEEAFQKVLVPNQQHGLMEIFRGNGGGGGGGSFYKLNLSGTPAPFPTPQPTFQPITSGGGGTVTQVVAEGDTLSAIAEHNGVSVEAIMQVNGLSDANIFVGQTLIIPIETAAEKVEGLRGMLSVVLYNQPDGSHRTEFGFSDPLHAYMLLEGDNLQEFENYQNRPVDIWGTILPNIDGILTVNVDRYEIPFPRLNFQILSGTDKEVNLESQSVMLFTGDDGQSYIELTPDCINPVGPDSVAGNGEVGQPILLEALIVPGVTYGGYPAACVSSKAMAIDPKSGQRVELLVTADQPYAMDEPSGVASSQPPTAAIEKIELAYYIRNPIYSITDSNAGADAQYLQPVWRFYGHYSNGDEFEILVQALKEEFLLPELAPNTPPG